MCNFSSFQSLCFQVAIPVCMFLSRLSWQLIEISAATHTATLMIASSKATPDGGAINMQKVTYLIDSQTQLLIKAPK